MEKIKLIFFDESVDIIKPKDFNSLKNEIEKKYLLNQEDVSELLIFYKKPEIIIISNNEDYKTFYDYNINTIYLDIKNNSQLYIKNLELVKNGKENTKEEIDHIIIKRKVNKIKNPNLDNNLKTEINKNKFYEKNKSHYGIKCSNCNKFPIIGCRYKCIICENFNICEQCETKIGIIHSHTLLKINSPIHKPIVLKFFLRKYCKID